MQHLILLVIIMLIIGLVFTVTYWRGGLDMTFSQHAATNRSSKIFYSLLFLITLPLLQLFFTAWLVPTKNLPDSFLWFSGLALFFQIACTLVPETGGSKTIIHRILTAISALALIPLVYIIAVSGHLATVIQYGALIGLLVMITIMVFALHKQKGSHYALLLQTGYYTTFFVIILLATYF